MLSATHTGLFAAFAFDCHLPNQLSRGYAMQRLEHLELLQFEA